MPATAITPSERFIHTGITKVIYMPACADIDTPTRAEINAGTDLSNEIAEVAGWSVASNQVDAPDLGRLFTAQITGRTSAEASSLTMYADITGTDVRALLPRGTDGFVLLAYGGDVEDNLADVYPVKVSAAPKTISVEDEAARLMVQFAITSEPAENVAIPATT